MTSSIPWHTGDIPLLYIDKDATLSISSLLRLTDFSEALVKTELQEHKDDLLIVIIMII